MTKQSFLQGTLILILAGMITRLLGFINRLAMARIMGEEGIGIYMMALPTLFLVITLTQMGLPIAISKRVAEAEAKGNQQKVKQILVISLIIVGITSIIFSLGLFISTPIIATRLLTDERTLYPLLLICPIVPVIAFASVLKGYFQGKQNMKPQSYAIIIEQVIRIGFVIFFIKLLLPFGLEYAAAGAMFSVLIGECASLLFIVYMFKQKKTLKLRNKFFSFVRSSKDTVKELFSIALPSTGSRMIGSFANFLEPILVAQSLAIAGISTTMATRLYGELTGYVMPLLFLPTFITISLSIALVPSISEADAYENEDLIHYRIHQAIRISFASGALATIVLTLFSDQILMFMYGTTHATRLLQFMAPFYILLYIQAPLQSSLQALDLARPAMWNSIIGSVCKLCLLFILASNPNIGIMGVAIAMSVGVILITLLHLMTLIKTIRFSIPFMDLGKMIVLLLLTTAFGYLLKNTSLLQINQLSIFVFVLILLSFIYIFLLFVLKFISKEELKQIPFLQKWL